MTTDRQDIEARLKWACVKCGKIYEEKKHEEHVCLECIRDHLEDMMSVMNVKNDQLRASLAREKKMRWALEQYRSSEIDLGPLIALETLIFRDTHLGNGHEGLAYIAKKEGIDSLRAEYNEALGDRIHQLTEKMLFEDECG